MIDLDSSFDHGFFPIQFMRYAVNQYSSRTILQSIQHLMGGCLGPRLQQCYAVATRDPGPVEAKERGSVCNNRVAKPRSPSANFHDTVGKLIGTIVLGTDAVDGVLPPFVPSLPPPLFALSRPGSHRSKMTKKKAEENIGNQ